MFGLSFEFPQISFLQFIVTLISGIAMIFGGGIYFTMLKIFGKEMKPYMTARLQKLSIFQVYTIGNSLNLRYARQEPGGSFRLVNIEGAGRKLGKKLGIIKEDNSELMTPHSTYNVEGVSTVLAFDLYPSLHSDFIDLIKIAQEKGYTRLSEFEDLIAKNQISKSARLTEKYTLEQFINMFHAVEKKYSLRITVDDVLKFLDKHSNQNFSESLATRDTNALKKKQRDNTARKYAFIIIALWSIGLLSILAYKVVGG